MLVIVKIADLVNSILFKNQSQWLKLVELDSGARHALCMSEMINLGGSRCAVRQLERLLFGSPGIA